MEEFKKVGKIASNNDKNSPCLHSRGLLKEYIPVLVPMHVWAGRTGARGTGAGEKRSLRANVRSVRYLVLNYRGRKKLELFLYYQTGAANVAVQVITYNIKSICSF